jgi:hypothetical protein
MAAVYTVLTDAVCSWYNKGKIYWIIILLTKISWYDLSKIDNVAQNLYKMETFSHALKTAQRIYSN